MGHVQIKHLKGLFFRAENFVIIWSNIQHNNIIKPCSFFLIFSIFLFSIFTPLKCLKSSKSDSSLFSYTLSITLLAQLFSSFFFLVVSHTCQKKISQRMIENSDQTPLEHRKWKWDEGDKRVGKESVSDNYRFSK